MATSTSLVTELASRNKKIAAAHQPIPTFAEMGEMGVGLPHVIVLTCVDPRCIPEYFLNLHPSDGVLVTRNICGHIAPALNDILALDAFLSIKEIMIVHHTDCGATHFTDDIVRETMKKRLPSSSHTEVDNIKTFGAIKDLEQSVRDDIALLKAAPLVRKELADAAVGFVYDLKTGELTPVRL
ncbi:Carbon disulfide hydrolase [Lachnellula suecica]|uniref:Carbonic anhydrase n=1 Tax=Lachnellula suecica TaxID=602035 RepID=A0A8T9C0C5_9HELO|nr:Carbon disulfide hydrolase [Lachnellula suecica]